MPRDYKQEYEKEKDKDYRKNFVNISIRVRKSIFEDFSSKCELSGVSKTKVLTDMIEDYVYGNNK